MPLGMNIEYIEDKANQWVSSKKDHLDDLKEIDKKLAIELMVNDYTLGIADSSYKDGYMFGLCEGFETGNKWAWSWLKIEDHEPKEGVPLLCLNGHEPKILYRKGDRYFSNIECDIEFLEETPKRYMYLKYKP